MIFKPNSTSFGRHETFGLRFGWLPKGYQALKENPKVFLSDDATVKLGVGKNMVSAIRYWLQAAQMLNVETGIHSELGELLLDVDTGFDPYLEDEATLWLIHWLISSNAEKATAFYWFFNKFHKPEFSQEEISTALSDWVKGNITHKVAPSTIKSDASLLPRMYANSRAIGRLSLEDALDSPLTQLRLISMSSAGRTYMSKQASRPGLPAEILGFAVSELMQTRQTKILPVEELMYSRDDYPAPGAVFRLTESDLIVKLEALVSISQGDLSIRDSAGIHQIYCEGRISPTSWLKKYYRGSAQEAAA